MFCVLEGKPKEFPARSRHSKYWFMGFGKSAARGLSPLVKQILSNQRVKPELGFLENHLSGTRASYQTLPPFRFLKLSQTYGETFRMEGGKGADPPVKVYG